MSGGCGRAVRTGRAVPVGPCAPTAATSAHTPFRTRSPVRIPPPKRGPQCTRPGRAGAMTAPWFPDRTRSRRQRAERGPYRRRPHSWFRPCRHRWLRLHSRNHNGQMPSPWFRFCRHCCPVPAETEKCVARQPAASHETHPHKVQKSSFCWASQRSPSPWERQWERWSMPSCARTLPSGRAPCPCRCLA